MDPITAHEQLKRERRAGPPKAPNELPQVRQREGWDLLGDLAVERGEVEPKAPEKTVERPP